LALAIPAFGGAPASVAPAPAPASTPALTEWFIGASYGQLNNVDTGLENIFLIENDGEVDFDLYSLQLGRTLGCFAGFNTAAYLEVGYGEGESGDIPYQYRDGNFIEYADANVDLEMIPVTLNYMMERNLIGGLGCYITAGAGYAWTNATMDFDGGYDDVDENDGGFYAQATAGLSYNFTETFEIFAGVRWSYLDSVDWADDLTLSDNDAWGWEVGARLNF
jgi:opacity protein-like surface antigen